VDFDAFHSTLDRVNLAQLKGAVTHVSGLTVESSGPADAAVRQMSGWGNCAKSVFKIIS
jgi:hypothetical protein